MRRGFKPVVRSSVACNWPRREYFSCRNPADSTNDDVSLSGDLSTDWWHGHEDNTFISVEESSQLGKGDNGQNTDSTQESVH